MEKEQWKSPRKIQEELQEYWWSRFEEYMVEVDNGAMTLTEAIKAMNSEIEVANGTVLR